MTDVRATASLDATGVEKGAKQASDAINKFGFSMDGVLTKLARQLSVTDIAAGAVFATIAKGRQIIADSERAYLSHEQALQKNGESYSVILERLSLLDSKMKQHNESIGAASAAWGLLSKTIEERFADSLDIAVQALAKIEKSPFLRALLMAGGGVGALISGAATLIGGAANAANGAARYSNYGPAIPPGLGASSGGGGYDVNERLMGSALRDFRDRTPYVAGYPGGGFPAVGAGDFDWSNGGGLPSAMENTNDVFARLFETQDEYNRRLEEQAEEMARAEAALSAFGQSIGHDVVGALFAGANAADAFKNAMLRMVEDILGRIAGNVFTSIIGSVIPGAGSFLGALNTGGGRSSIATTPTPQALQFYRSQIAPAMAYEQRRGR